MSLKQYIALLAAFALLTQICSAQISTTQAFFRITADHVTSIKSINPSSGYLSWSNAVMPGTCTVEVAENFSSTNPWRSYVMAAITTKVHSVQLFDPNSPSGMVLIPEGPFTMGNSFPTNDHDCGVGAEVVEYPAHTVTVSKFYIETHEVTSALWEMVRDWSVTNSYNYSTNNPGTNTNGPTHPAGNSSWYDCIKWCNARSEMEGLTPCYYIATNRTADYIYRSGALDISNNWVRWTVNGYRLPTEAEWEKACRGGLIGTRFPWGDTITHSNANYFSSEYFSTNSYPDSTTNLCFYDLSPTRGYHPAYSNNATGTAPVGSFAPNGYGLYDMSGNVNEWCWDWYDQKYYSTSPSKDPRGPTGPTAGNTNRILRGGGWHAWDASLHRCAYRMGNPPHEKTSNRGLRCVRSQL